MPILATLLGEGLWSASSLVTFAAEVGQRFQFLVHLYGMEGPEGRDLLLRSVFYRRPGLSVAVFLDHGRDTPGRRILVSVSLEAAHIYRAALPGLVEAAGFAPAHRVGWKAHTVAAMQRTLDDNAIWLGRLMPVLLGPEALDLTSKGPGGRGDGRPTSHGSTPNGRAR
jgi:hypothetical protein